MFTYWILKKVFQNLNFGSFFLIFVLKFGNFAGGVFIVIFVGIALAILTLIFEYWYDNH